MPLYEYQCESCGNRFERIQKFSDPPVETCPSCEGAVRKLLSSPAIQFKGSGWYITDYARKGPSGDGGKTGTSEAGKTSDAASGGDAKPASGSTPASSSGSPSGSTGGA
jgi:putative FmdB family regulatory protein